MHTPWIAAAVLLATLPLTAARGADLLPYSTRHHSYSGWTSTVFGDVRTVGMAGATIGLPDTFLSSADNPAGLSMLMGNADQNYSTNSINDGHVQSRGKGLTMDSFGLAAGFYPWAVSVGYVTVSREGQAYQLPTVPGEPLVAVTSNEFRLGLARNFLRDRLALGASLNIGRAQELMDFADTDATTDLVAHDIGFGATFGALAQVRHHLFVGLSYAMPIAYAFYYPSGPPPPVTGFYKPLVSPPRLGTGVGYVANRFFRASGSAHVIGTTRGASLLSSDSTSVGDRISFQLRGGAAYQFIDFKEFNATAFAGSYLEMSRIENTSHRVHLTGGIETHLWIFTLGAGGDFAPRYSNILFSIGMDPIKLMMKLDIIPTPYSPPRAGFFPAIAKESDEGLARPLVRDWRPQGPDMNPVKVIQDIPARTEQKIEAVKEALSDQEKKRGTRAKRKGAAKKKTKPLGKKPKPKATRGG